tara:strand:+ start:575 stop:823 length:249 start_codon:yes stop_codon:yes gene_type:complete
MRMRKTPVRRLSKTHLALRVVKSVAQLPVSLPIVATDGENQRHVLSRAAACALTTVLRQTILRNRLTFLKKENYPNGWVRSL